MNEEEELKEGYARLRNDFWSNVKIRKLQKANPSAGLIYVRSIAYASDRLTDGDLTIDDLDLNLGATQEEIDTLVEAGLFEPSTIGYHIHDYLNNNRSREEITGTTSRNTERKRRSRMNAKVVNGEYTTEFEAFWKAYPRKVDKRAAFKAWATAIRETDADTLIQAAAAYSRQCATDVTGARYIKHAATWLHGGCWENPDEPTSTAITGYGTQRQSKSQTNLQNNLQRTWQYMSEEERQQATRGGANAV